jgi:hypothetical protein
LDGEEKSILIRKRSSPVNQQALDFNWFPWRKIVSMSPLVISFLRLGRVNIPFGSVEHSQ